MKKVYLILLVLLSGIAGYSQNTASNKALEAYNNMFYADAAKMYQQIVDNTGGTQEELINLADSYLKLQQYIDAELTYEKLFKAYPQQSQHIVLKYAQTLAYNGRYDESIKYYEEYIADDRGKNFASAYKSLNKFYRDSSHVSVKFLPINTTYTEYSPVIFDGGLAFCSNRNANAVVKKVYGWNKTPYSDLYFIDTLLLNSPSMINSGLANYKEQASVKNSSPNYTAETSNDNRTIGHYSTETSGGKGLLEAIPFHKEINSKEHEGPACFSKNFDTLFFTRNSYYKGNIASSSGKNMRLQIFYAIKDEAGNYTNVQSFPYNHPDHSVGHPALSPDGRRLYFVSDKPGGLGETDIYYCVIREHRFTEPVNAGSVINTPGSEMFPSFNQDGSLYFASNGHVGLGGLDIFRADFANNEFEQPENLRFPINSNKDDFGVTSANFHGTQGYFSSNRIRGRSDDNIYSFADTRPRRILITGVIKAQNREENGKSYIEPVEGAVITLAPLGDKITTDRSGKFEFWVERGKSYSIEGSKGNGTKIKKEIDLSKISDKQHIYSVDLELDNTSAPATY